MKAIREAVSTELLKAELTAERFLRVTRKGENEIYSPLPASLIVLQEGVGGSGTLLPLWTES